MHTLYVHMHLPKTGGTTFDIHLSRNMAWDREFVQLSNWGDTDREKHGRLPYHERPASERLQARVISGHKAYWGIDKIWGGDEARYLTFMRDPAARCVSRYNFDRSLERTTASFEQWYNEEFLPAGPNTACQFYARLLMQADFPDAPQNLKLAKKLLDLCWFVGLTEHLNDDLPWLFSTLGVPTDWENYRVADGKALDEPSHLRKGERVTRFFELSSTWAERIRKDSRLDTELYHYAQELHADSHRQRE